MMALARATGHAMPAPDMRWCSLQWNALSPRLLTGANQTNNRAEYSAAIRALELSAELDPSGRKDAVSLHR